MIDFIRRFNFSMVVDTSHSVMNRICWHIEQELNDVRFQSTEVFDISILKTDKEYAKKDFDKVKAIYESYKSETSAYTVRHKECHSRTDDYTSDRDTFKLNFLKRLSILKINDEDLGNIVIDLCYLSHNSKQFAWDVAGEQILKNLLVKNNHIITIPTQCENGNVEFNGHRFTIIQKKVGDGFADSN
jgi:hypothetical protein